MLGTKASGISSGAGPAVDSSADAALAGDGPAADSVAAAAPAIGVAGAEVGREVALLAEGDLVGGADEPSELPPVLAARGPPTSTLAYRLSLDACR